MLKKNGLYENVWQPVCNRGKSPERSGRPDINRDTCHELKRGPTGRRSSNTRQLGCVFQEMKPPKSISRKSADIQKPTQCVKFTKAIARHTTIRDKNPSLGKFPQVNWQKQGAREAAWKLAKSVLKEQHSSHLRQIGACLHQL